jgi:cytochrome c peroxidase
MFAIRHARRCFTSSAAPTPNKGGFSKTTALLTTAAGGAAGLLYIYLNKQSSSTSSQAEASHGPTAADFYRQVGKDVARILESDPSYDGIGHYGPVLVRLAWHASGTYDAKSHTGGSNGATMRFSPESAHGANAGLAIARDLLEPLKQKYGDRLSYADLWTLGGVVAIKGTKPPTSNNYCFIIRRNGGTANSVASRPI